MQKHLIYVPYSEYTNVSELLLLAHSFLSDVSKEYDLQPFSPDREPLNISFFKKINDEFGIDEIVIQIDYFVFDKN